MKRDRLSISLAVFAFFLPWQVKFILRNGVINGGQNNFLEIAVYGYFLALVVFVFFASYQMVLKKYWLKSFSRFNLALLLLILSLSLAIFFSPDYGLALSHFLYFFGGAALLFLSRFLKKEIRWELVLNTFLISCALSAILGIFQFSIQEVPEIKYLVAPHQVAEYAGESVLENNGARLLRAYGGLDHPNIFGGLMVVALILLIEKMLKIKSKEEWLALVFVFLIFIRKTTLLRSSLITLLLYVLLAIFYWKILGQALYISYGKGIFVAVDIFIIIFGAIFFLEILKDLNIIKNISYYISNISKDYRVQVILIAWFFECFLEGTAGFGTPAAVAVPLLVGLGITPIRALILGLLGNSTPGIFGAAGTPIKIGFSTLNVSAVPFYSALFNFVGILVPIFMIWIITKGRQNRKKEFFEALPFAIWSGILFLVPSFLTARYIGQEFPTIFGSIIGLFFAILSIKLKIFTPKNNLSLNENVGGVKTMSLSKSFLPYGLLVVLLILGKIILGKIGISMNLGFSHIFNLFNPGFIFIIAGSIIASIWKSKKIIILKSFKNAAKGAVLPFLIIASMLSMVQIMINSGNNMSGIPSAINLMAKTVEFSFLPFLAPLAGAFGAFMTGSVTTSNVMFGALFNTAALNMGFNTDIILSLLVVGASLGNMIALADILTAEAVIGEKNAERKIVKGVLAPCLICLFIVGVIGMVVLK